MPLDPMTEAVRTALNGPTVPGSLLNSPAQGKDMRALPTPVAGPEAATLPEALGGTLTTKQWQARQAGIPEIDENGYGQAPDSPKYHPPVGGAPGTGTAPDPILGDDAIRPGTPGGPGLADVQAPVQRPTIQSREGGVAPQALGAFASQFAGIPGGQGPKSYTHSLRPERGTVVR